MRRDAVILIIVNSLSISLIGLLFFTAHLKRIPRHPIVSTLLWMAIPRSLVACMPAFSYNDLRAKLPWKLHPDRFDAIEHQQSSLARFCAAQGILMYYFLAAQAFFAVSFTIPMLIIAIQSAKLWREESQDSIGAPRSRVKHVKLPSGTLLSSLPFVWSLPMIIVAIPVLIHGTRSGYPVIYYTPMGYCTIDSYVYQVIASALVALPIIAGFFIYLLVFIYMVKFYTAHKGVPLRGRSVDIGLLLRFSGMLLIIFLDAIILLCEITVLDDNKLLGLWNFDLYWTTMTPLVEFFLLGSQATLLETWARWLLIPVQKISPSRTNKAIHASNEDAAHPAAHRSDTHINHSIVAPRLHTQPQSAIVAPALAIDDSDDGASDTEPQFIHQDIHDEELEWSSEEGELDHKLRAKRRARQRARRPPVLFQWEGPKPASKQTPAPAQPPRSPTADRSTDHAEVETDTPAQAADMALDADDGDDPKPRWQYHVPRKKLFATKSSTSTSTITAPTMRSMGSATPLRPHVSQRHPSRSPRGSRPTSPTFVYPVSPRASTSRAEVRTSSRTSLAESYGPPMDYMYGEMHTFMGIAARPRTRAVELRSAAHLRFDRARLEEIIPPRISSSSQSNHDDGEDGRHHLDTSTPRNEPSVKARRRSQSKLFHEDIRLASLKTVDESLVEIPSQMQGSMLV